MYRRVQDASWKSWNVLEFCHFHFQAWKVLEKGMFFLCVSLKNSGILVIVTRLQLIMSLYGSFQQTAALFVPGYLMHHDFDY